MEKSATGHGGVPRLAPLAGLVLLSAIVYLVGLGRGGLVSTEGHRVLPAWEMLESGDYLGQKLFGTFYLRKPPGFTWAVAACTACFGSNEFAARLTGGLSGMGMVILLYLFAARWFGEPWATLAGLAQLATPLFWKFSRCAEIEPFNNVLTLAAVLLTLELLLIDHRRPWIMAILSVGLFVSVLGLLLTKGPSGLPCVAGGIVASCWIGGLRKTLNWPVLAAIACAGLMFGGFCWALRAHVLSTHEMVVTQPVSIFLWSFSSLPGILALGPLTLLWAMPASLLLALPWMEVPRTGDELLDRRRRRMARAIAVTCFVSLGIYSIFGVNNPRYALPATTFISLLASYAGPLAASLWRQSKSWRRAWVAGACSLALGWGVYVGWGEPHTRRSSGRSVGEEIARWLPDGAEVWADSLVEARPETLGYAQLAAEEDGKRVKVRWVKPDERGHQLPPSGHFIVLRTDDEEVDRYAREGLMDRMLPVTSGTVYKYSFILFRVDESSIARHADDTQRR